MVYGEISIKDKIELIDNILTPEDFVKLRVTTGFADIPAPHARKALQNGLLNVSAVKDGKLIHNDRRRISQR